MIVIRFSSVDGAIWKRKFSSEEKARAAVLEQLGPVELGSTYAVSGDGICKAEIATGDITMRKLMQEVSS